MDIVSKRNQCGKCKCWDGSVRTVARGAGSHLRRQAELRAGQQPVRGGGAHVARARRRQAAQGHTRGLARRLHPQVRRGNVRAATALDAGGLAGHLRAHTSKWD